jgi:hypothetical protein
VKFGERGKSSGRHSSASGFKRGLTVSLTKGWPRGCVDLVKGVNRGCRLGFNLEVMTQVDLGLTSDSPLDSADSVISGNDC